ncbi:hypothetical protein F7734_58550 [Scytonema sp. UIC 10036]|uniref:hypothetical protein n=1 Tax=Scytonema sp. UIC 10036 TaxID=2304196 RepID=UPI0012DAA25B|nr:hypothetical protein [Scytonema sp. UIC 10036]MUH01549.1 hypothetical protein [Scytonema sp. UIC 10036]
MGERSDSPNGQLILTELTDLSIAIERLLFKITENPQKELLKDIHTEINNILVQPNQKLSSSRVNLTELNKIKNFRGCISDIYYSQKSQVKIELLNEILLTIKELQVAFNKVDSNSKFFYKKLRKLVRNKFK